ncbi:hypothetical protein QUW47_02490 [Phocaeicola barnesiae]|nr:hypothetical protein [Phocaeicola barnesiae]MDM8240774.1 hypothetical protein [Phocaeicola barnesiae]
MLLQEAAQETAHPDGRVILLHPHRIVMVFREIGARRRLVAEGREAVGIREHLRPGGVVGLRVRSRERKPAQVLAGRVVRQGQFLLEPVGHRAVSLRIDIRVHHPYVDKHAESVERAGTVHRLHPGILRQFLSYLLQAFGLQVVEVEGRDTGAVRQQVHLPSVLAVARRYQGRQRPLDAVGFIVPPFQEELLPPLYPFGKSLVCPDLLDPLFQCHQAFCPFAVHVGEQRHLLIFHKKWI